MASVTGQDLQKAIALAIHNRDFSLLPASFYLGLGYGTFPTKDADVATLSEVVGPGYARILLPNDAVSFPSLVLSGSADWKITSIPFRFENTGPDDWTAADWAFLTDTASGDGRFFGAASITPFLLRYNASASQGDTYDLSWETIPVS